ncbi:MAG: aminoglycoside phosphotransferase family protein [Lutibacter sp.]|uniref:phosphotransferase enzyme family protein n=1 Tax=Lutibacter sp. TaxID=1925666 RepID=UPI003858003F
MPTKSSEKTLLQTVFNQFELDSSFSAFSVIVSGHINDTYLIKTSKKPYVLLQRINKGVFKNVPSLIQNKVAISKHLVKKLQQLPKAEINRKVLQFITTKNNQPYYVDTQGNYWNMMVYIDKSITLETVSSPEIAYEGGKLFGDFLNLTNDFDATQLTEVIPKFHDMSFRFEQFDSALKTATSARKNAARKQLEEVENLRTEMHIIQQLKESGQLKIRVTHNDAKLSNALFTEDFKGLCVIDTDTVMPGIVHYDFGDAIRTFCNTAVEDEKNLDLVTFNVVYYKAYLKGFLESLGSNLSATELKYLPLAAKTMIFIMALRFLTDYLNNDVYYKTNYPSHNLDRSKNQFKLIESFTKTLNNLN